MQSISSAALEILESGSFVGLSMACSNGLTITDANIIQGTFVLDRNSVSGNVIEIGNAETTEVRFTLDNSSGQYDAYSWAGETLTVDLVFGVETLRVGVFTIDNSPKKLKAMTITALDNMAKFNNKYVTGTATTLGELLADCCNACGVTLNTTVFTNSTATCSQPTTDTTYHQVVAWVAQLAGANAFIGHNGELYLGWYGEFQSEVPTISAEHRFDFEVAETDITITGVGHYDGETETIVGTDNYALVIEGNELVSSNITTILNNIYTKIGSYSYRPYSFSILPMPHLWQIDEINILMPDGVTVVPSIITNHKYTLNGRSAISGQGQAEEQYGYASAPPLTAQQKVIISTIADNKVEASATTLESATLALNQLIANSMGYYTTTIDNGDGSKTTYIHNESTLETSDLIYTITGSGFAWTESGWNSGNPAWEYGITGTGNAILKTLIAQGINADWINAGSIDTDVIYVGSETLTTALANMQTQITGLASGSSNFLFNSTWGTYDNPADNFWGEGMTWEILEKRGVDWNTLESSITDWNDFESGDW